MKNGLSIALLAAESVKKRGRDACTFPTDQFKRASSAAKGTHLNFRVKDIR